MAIDPYINTEIRRFRGQADACLKRFKRALRGHQLNEGGREAVLAEGGAWAGATLHAALTGRQRAGGKLGRIAGRLAADHFAISDEQIMAAYRAEYEQLRQQVAALLSQVSVAEKGLCAPGNSQRLLRSLERTDDCQRLQTSFRRLATQLRGLGVKQLVWNSSLPPKPAKTTPAKVRDRPRKPQDLLGDIWHEQRARIEESLTRLGLADHLEAIEEQLGARNPEQWRSAVYSCRSLVVDLADYLWRDPRPEYEHLPGQGKGRKLEVTHEKAANRLGAYLHQKGIRGSGGKLLRDEMTRVGDSFRSVLRAQGGAHQRVTREDAKRIAMFTLMVISQLAAATDLEPIVQYGPPAFDKPQ